MEKKVTKLAEVFSCLPPVLNRDNVNGDVKIACQQLDKFQAMKNSKAMFQAAIEGKGSTGTGQKKSSRAADFREKTNHDEIPKEQEEVKELRNLTTDSFSDFNLGQNGGYQSNQGQTTKPSGVFRERLRGGPRGGLAQSQRNTQGLKDNDMRMFQRWRVGLRHAPQLKTMGRGYKGRGRGFQGVNQLGGDIRSQFSQRQSYSEGGASQQNRGKKGLHEGKATQLSDSVDSNPKRNSTCSNSPRGPSVGDDPRRPDQGNHGKPWNSGGRERGQRGMRRAPSFSSFQSACHPEAIDQSRFPQNQLLVSGLSALTTEDCLVNFIQAMSGGEVEDIMMRNDKALITMANDVTGKSCQDVLHGLFDGRQISLVPVVPLFVSPGLVPGIGISRKTAAWRGKTLSGLSCVLAAVERPI